MGRGLGRGLGRGSAAGKAGGGGSAKGTTHAGRGGKVGKEGDGEKEEEEEDGDGPTRVTPEMMAEVERLGTNGGRGYGAAPHA